jgi:hypothetical protein
MEYHEQISQETGRLNAMDLMEVNPALAKTEAEAGRCREAHPQSTYFTVRGQPFFSCLPKY